MINRVLIRLKVIQVIYAYYQNGGKNLEAAEKELFYSMSKAYDLYKYLLLLMIEVTQFADRRIDKKQTGFCVPDAKRVLFLRRHFMRYTRHCAE